MDEIMSNKNPEILECFPLPILENIAEITDKKKRKLNTFINIKRTAIYRLGIVLIESLHIFQNSRVIRTHHVIDFDEIHKLFSWNFQHIMAKLDLNELWITLIGKNFAKDELESRKLVIDLNELEYLVRLTIQTYLQNGSVENLRIQMEAATDLQYIEEEFLRQYNENKDMKRAIGLLQSKLSTQLYGFRLAIPTQHGYIDEITERAAIRYKLGFMNCQINQLELSYDKTLIELENEITYYIQKIRDGEEISAEIKGYYGRAMIPLKERIKFMEAKYENDSEREYVRTQNFLIDMKKIETKRTVLEAEMARFRKETQEWEDRQQRKRIIEEANFLREQALQQEQLAMKSKKGGKSKKKIRRKSSENKKSE